jgi:hypothetical protein
MNILAIDPGPKRSACVQWNGKRINWAYMSTNYDIYHTLRIGNFYQTFLVIEQIKSYGMTVSDSIFDTVFWSGRFSSVFECNQNPGKWARLPRMEVKMNICHDSRAKDKNIRQALIDRFGPPGVKKNPGLTYGLKKDLWAAFALAVTWYDRISHGKGLTRTQMVI